VVLCGIAAHNQYDVSVTDIRPTVCHAPSTKGLSQSPYGWGVSETGAMFKVDNAQRPHQFC
jgi:hypothetical protein